MPLTLELKSGEKLILNGAVIENSGHTCRLTLHNEATLLRQKEILTEDKAKTPATRAYFALQCAYIFSERRQEHLDAFQTYLLDFLHACPSTARVGQQIMAALTQSDYYKALKAARKLIQHEKEVFASLQPAKPPG